MAITLDGTNGITTPAVTNNGAYTGDGISFADGTPSNTLVTTTGGNVGIGTSSPSNAGNSNNRGITLNGAGTAGFVELQSSGTAYGLLYGNSSEVQLRTATAIPLLFGTNTTERMRIDSSGNLGVGTTSIPFNGINLTKSSASCYLSVYGGTGNEGGVLLGGDGAYNKANLIWNPSSGALVMVTNQSNPIQVKANQTGGVQLSANATSWSSLSDESTKDIIEPISDATNKVSTLRAVIGKYKTDEEGTRRSFLIAQDVQAVLPEAVSDFNNTDGTTNLALAYTDVIPLLVASIKELKAELDTVKTELATLKGTV